MSVSTSVVANDSVMVLLSGGTRKYTTKSERIDAPSMAALRGFGERLLWSSINGDCTGKA
ncbi:uncharacterized protein FPOAC1_013257 [Fusarium poae]|uniref:uncharacterized protein n=1 Tax=Fusarium poae TaxID=36050 RepID=UPI001D04CE83|nr:uncharacterized protein FPOAC1_013257 [Fusarium poae]KAG8665278.1 hypothetical protein FPOAC1_013257 [Fusarium poae]